MKVLVTGATGFIGQYIIPILIREGHEVVATSLHEQKAKDSSWFSDVSYVEYNITSPPSQINDLYSYFDAPDQVIHLAWEGVNQIESMIHIEKNLMAHYDFLKKLAAGGVKELTVIGTCLEYGFRSGCLDESMVTEPHVAYAIAKDSLRKFLELIQVQYSFKLKWVRLFYMYGRGQHEKSLFAQLEEAIDSPSKEFNMSGGEQERDYLPIETVANNIVKIAFKLEQGIINCCQGHPITVKKLVQEYISKRGVNGMKINYGFYPYRTFESMSFWGSDARMKNLLG